MSSAPATRPRASAAEGRHGRARKLRDGGVAGLGALTVREGPPERLERHVFDKTSGLGIGRAVRPFRSDMPVCILPRRNCHLSFGMRIARRTVTNPAERFPRPAARRRKTTVASPIVSREGDGRLGCVRTVGSPCSGIRFGTGAKRGPRRSPRTWPRGRPRTRSRHRLVNSDRRAGVDGASSDGRRGGRRRG